jgi:hypothetical protein
MKCVRVTEPMYQNVQNHCQEGIFRGLPDPCVPSRHAGDQVGLSRAGASELVVEVAAREVTISREGRTRQRRWPSISCQLPSQDSRVSASTSLVPQPDTAPATSRVS